jgi:hypothetical protein
MCVVLLELGFMAGKHMGEWDEMGWWQLWLVESSCLSFDNGDKWMGRYVLWSCQYGGSIYTYSLVFADYIPKGASRGAATPIGALLRKDMASVCGGLIQMSLLLSRSQSSVIVCRSVDSSR